MHARSPHPPRELRLARLPLLLAYLLVLLGTPVGEAGFLWMHLTTAHSSPARPHADQDRSGGPRLVEALPASAPEHAHDTPPAHEHEHAAEQEHAAKHEHAGEHEHAPTPAHEHAIAHEHVAAPRHEHAGTREHHERVASAEAEPVAQTVAPDEPHEHGGRVHTHRQHPVPDAELLTDALSKFYLAPPLTPAATLSADARHARPVPPSPHQVAARIDTPPPRLLG